MTRAKPRSHSPPQQPAQALAQFGRVFVEQVLRRLRADALLGGGRQEAAQQPQRARRRGDHQVVERLAFLAFADAFTLRYPDAYERLLMDVVRGNLSLFMRRDEVDAAWAWADDLLAAWEQVEGEPFSYPAGSDGPTQAALMLDRDSRAWWDPQ